jgi:hypothetical protein
MPLTNIFEISNSKASIVFWTIIAVLIFTFIILLYFISEETYIWLGTEDSLGENLTAIFYAIAGILLFVYSYKELKLGESIKLHILTILLGLFFLFIALEEISWGQRIFNFSTPELLGTHNIQDEFNLHNISLFDKGQAFINQHTALNGFVFFTGILFPLLYFFVPLIRKYFNKINFPIVPISVTPIFVLSIIHGQTLAKYFQHWSHPEVKELMISIGYLLFSVSLFMKLNKISTTNKEN